MLWSELTEAAFAEGLRRPGLTGYTALTVGGVLAVGGVPMCSRVGAVVDSVRELDVVTGDGRLVTCSDRHHRDLFEAVLGGVGQYGIVVRARLDLVPAQQRARTFFLTYASADDFWSDWLTLLERGEFHEAYDVGFPPSSPRPAYQLWATVYYDPPAEPDPSHLLRGLRHPAAAPALDQDYVAFTQTVDRQIEALQAAQWDRLVKPWYDVFLPQTRVREHVTEVIGELTPEDVGPAGFVLVFALERSHLRRPFFRMPPDDGERWVFLFDVLGCSVRPGPDPEYAARMLARNRRWFDRAAALGGTRYPIGAQDFQAADWARHYGDLWPEAQRRKRRYDPAGILTPGPGIFRGTAVRGS